MVGVLTIIGGVVLLLFIESLVARWRDQELSQRLEELEKHGR